MKKNKLFRNRKGFSLVELMVVVAIIGVLAVIGIPQYQKFMAKARQAEAKAHLNGIFQGESSFFTEYNQYTTNMQAIGAAATGTGLRYNAGTSITACTDYTTAAGAPALGAAATNDIRSLSPATVATWFYTTLVDPTVGACVSTSGAASFTMGAWGNPTNVEDTGANNKDVFTIDNMRKLAQTAIGI